MSTVIGTALGGMKPLCGVRIIVIGPNTGDDRWQIYQKYFTKIVGDGWAGLVLKLDLDIIRI